MEEERVNRSRGCFFCKSGKEAEVIRHFNMTFPEGKAIVATRTKIKRIREAAIEEYVGSTPNLMDMV